MTIILLQSPTVPCNKFLKTLSLMLPICAFLRSSQLEIPLNLIIYIHPPLHTTSPLYNRSLLSYNNYTSYTINLASQAYIQLNLYVFCSFQSTTIHRDQIRHQNRHLQTWHRHRQKLHPQHHRIIWR